MPSDPPTGPLGQDLLQPGDLLPPVCGAHTDGAFFSVEVSLGRSLVVVAADGAAPDVQSGWMERFRSGAAELAGLGADSIMLLTMSARSVAAHLNPPTPGVVIADPSVDLDGLGGSGPHPDVLVVDRAGRLVARISAADADTAFRGACAAAARLQTPPPMARMSSAPLLVVTHLIPPSLCTALIAAFEAGDHEEGAMASIDVDGRPMVRHEEGKKRRRDLVLTSDSPLHGLVIDALSRRLVPEIAKAFNVHVAHADRMLIARYDDTGGYFHKHRDNAAPHVAFRQFAVSMNLNTGDYEGGELEFPEYSADVFAPPAGSAAVFSASLLHAARPVTRGSRYVLLTFLHDDQAEARRQALVGDGNSPGA